MNTRWEYEIIFEEDVNVGDKPLWEAGAAEGWEIISVVPSQRDRGTTNLIYSLRCELLAK